MALLLFGQAAVLTPFCAAVRPGRSGQRLDRPTGDPHQPTRRTRLVRAAAVPDPEDPAGWPTRGMLLPHIDALASHVPPDTGTETTTYLLNQAEVFPGDHGQVGPERVSRHVQETLAARGNLAVVCQAAEDLGRAIPLMPGW